MSLAKIRIAEDEAQNGAETIEIVLGIVLAIGLGAALLMFQDLLRNKINDTKDTFNNVFTNMIKGANGTTNA